MSQEEEKQPQVDESNVNKSKEEEEKQNGTLNKSNVSCGPIVIKKNRSVTNVNNKSKMSRYSEGSKSFSKLFLNPISKFESVNTLQNSAKNVIFSKDIRFKKIKTEAADCLYSPKNCSFAPSAGIGYGIRGTLFSKNGYPSPNAYKIRSVFETNLQHNKGPVLASRANSEKQWVSPGPGQYHKDDSKSWLKDISTSITLRHGFYYDDYMRGRNFISPQQYYIKRDFVESRRYNGIGFGYGNKTGMAKSDTPGVGTYNLPYSFDLKRGKPPIN